MVINRPIKKEQVRIKNLWATYCHLKFYVISTFLQLHKVEMLIEEEMQKNQNNAYQIIRELTTKTRNHQSSMAIHEINAVKALKFYRKNKVFTLLGMKTNEALKSINSEGLIKSIGSITNFPKKRAR